MKRQEINRYIGTLFSTEHICLSCAHVIEDEGTLRCVRIVESGGRGAFVPSRIDKDLTCCVLHNKDIEPFTSPVIKLKRLT